MDLIRLGKAPAVIRRKGAEGNLPLSVEDKIEILTFLAAAPEADLRAKALATLRGWSGVDLRRVMANPQTAPEVLRFAADQLLAEREELREILLWNPSLPADAHPLLARKSPPKDASVETSAAALNPPSAGLPPSDVAARDCGRITQQT